MKNLEELRKMDKIELQKKVNEYRKEAFNLRFQKSSGQLENVSRISKVKKEIARIKTIMNKKRKEK
ncbi:MAG: 50S ribosomal protein L29 [Rickettsiales bacterium]|nr:50S ribosomal protein L29 [Rickettsiales bacterium]|tara:strand:- start:44663 stop:44860 length:198 start_codon:yes stop_codon:yes gene_type:complete